MLQAKRRVNASGGGSQAWLFTAVLCADSSTHAVKRFQVTVLCQPGF
jgi:hypothetical protein